MAASSADASKPAHSVSGPIPFKDVVNDDDGAVPMEHTPVDDLVVAALPRRQNPVLELRQYQGFWLPAYWIPGVAEFQRRFIPRPDDVVLASFPKSGTTWLMALAFATLSRATHPPTASTHPLRRLHPHDCVPFIDELFSRGGAEAMAKLDALPSPRLMSTHLPHSLLPGRVAAGGCRVVYVCRDPKDVVVSLWHFIRRSGKPELSLAGVVEAVCHGTVGTGPVWDHLLSYWRAGPEKVLFLRYEDMVRDPGESVRRLARFVGRPFSAAEEAAGDVEAVVELCSFERMKGMEVNRDGCVTAGSYLAMPRDSFFRKGVTEDWVNFLTPEMAGRLDGVFREKLRGTGLTFA